MIIKPWYTSKTVWVNIIAFVLLVLALPQFISVVPVSWIPFIALIAAILNGVLRIFFTSQPITASAAAIAPVQ
jgi:hypothetical protein